MSIAATRVTAAREDARAPRDHRRCLAEGVRDHARLGERLLERGPGLLEPLRLRGKRVARFWSALTRRFSSSIPASTVRRKRLNARQATSPRTAARAMPASKARDEEDDQPDQDVRRHATILWPASADGLGERRDGGTMAAATRGGAAR